ncbi:MAG: hypothetical protein Q9M36_10995 [Sulfurovum sp.]|nr:hypothetical protein [Sulfurovum sp.]
MGFNVKAGNSTISIEDAGILVEYAITGTLPKNFKKPSLKSGIRIVKKKVTMIKKVADHPTGVTRKEVTKVNLTPEKTPIKEAVLEVVEEKVVAKAIVKTVEESIKFIEEVKIPLEIISPKVTTEATKEAEVEATLVPKEVKKRKGISVVSKKPEVTPEDKETTGEKKPLRRVLSRGGIKIVKKAKPVPMRAGKRISFGSTNYEPYIGKKKPKKIAHAKEAGTRMDIFNHDSMSSEIDSGFGGEEVVLLDFSDKNIYEDMMRQEQKRKEEMKKREAKNGGPGQRKTSLPSSTKTFFKAWW